jgi:hypothetical protein
VGTVEVPAAGGYPRNYRVISNTAAKANETIARAAVAQLMGPAVPEAVLKGTKSGEVFTMEESFTTYEEGQPTPAIKRR